VSLRHCTVSKFFAVWFVITIVLPFTAPFQTWDPMAPVGKAPSHDAASSDKLSKDAAAVAVIASSAPVLLSISLSIRRLVDGQAHPQALHTVLRL
jgi:hypothetical protein